MMDIKERSSLFSHAIIKQARTTFIHTALTLSIDDHNSLTLRHFTQQTYIAQTHNTLFIHSTQHSLIVFSHTIHTHISHKQYKTSQSPIHYKRIQTIEH